MDEAAPGSAGADDPRGYRGAGGEERSPLQTRAAFLKNWSWESVAGINQRACARGGAQHGANSETGTACSQRWEEIRHQELTLPEIYDQLRGFHRSAPFLFLNGNTFSSIGRELSLAVFSDLSPVRKRELSSAVAHYIAGVLDRESMISAVESLCESASFAPGDRVQTLRGSTAGKVVKILEDGRVVWKPDGMDGELIGLPEGLKKKSVGG